MRITDIKNMPNFNEEVKNGMDSVDVGKIYMQKYEFGEYPHCKEHGAILKVSSSGIWRCPACNEGCYELEGKK